MTASQNTVPIAKEELDRLVKEVSDSKSVLAEMGAMARRAADDARRAAEENKALKVQLAEALVANELLQKSRAARPATQPNPPQASQKPQGNAGAVASDPNKEINEYRRAQRVNVGRLMHERFDHAAAVSYAAVLEDTIRRNDPDNPIIMDPATGKHYPEGGGLKAFSDAVRKRFTFPEPLLDRPFMAMFVGPEDPFGIPLRKIMEPLLSDLRKRDVALINQGAGLRDRMKKEIGRHQKKRDEDWGHLIDQSCLRLLLRNELRRLLPEHPLAADEDLAVAIGKNAQLAYSLSPPGDEAWEAADRVAHSTFVARVKESPAMASICERMGVAMLVMPPEAAVDALKMLEHCSPRSASATPRG